MKRYLSIIPILAIIVLSFSACKSSDYSKAENLMSNGQYYEAANLFSNISGYKDSTTKASTCRFEYVNELRHNNDVNGVINSLNEYKDFSDSKLNEIKTSYFFEDYGYVVPMKNFELDNPNSWSRNEKELNGRNVVIYECSDSTTTRYVDSYNIREWVNLIEKVDCLEIKKAESNKNSDSLKWGEKYLIYKDGEEIGCIGYHINFNGLTWLASDDSIIYIDIRAIFYI